MSLKSRLLNSLTLQAVPDDLLPELERDRLADNTQTAYLLSLLFTLTGFFLIWRELLLPADQGGFIVWSRLIHLYITITMIAAGIAAFTRFGLPRLSSSRQETAILISGTLLISATTILSLYSLREGNDLADFLLGILIIAVGFRFSIFTELILIGGSTLSLIAVPLINNYQGNAPILVLVIYVVVVLWLGHNLENQRIENLLLTEKLRSRNQELRDLSSTDALTGISNRRAFFEHTEFLMEQSKRYGSQLSIILMDIDRFKRVNDTLGHAVGDEVLKEFADLMKEATRSSDLFARYGGEEFILAMPHTRLGAAASTAERLRREIERHRFSGVDWTITISLGVADFDPVEESLEETLIRADRAMYQVKDQGGNGVTAAG